MGGLKIHHTNVSKLWGYHSTFGEYAESLHKLVLSGSGAPVVVEHNIPAVYQLWGEAQGIIHMYNADMLPC